MQTTLVLRTQANWFYKGVGHWGSWFNQRYFSWTEATHWVRTFTRMKSEGRVIPTYSYIKVLWSGP